MDQLGGQLSVQGGKYTRSSRSTEQQRSPLKYTKRTTHGAHILGWPGSSQRRPPLVIGNPIGPVLKNGKPMTRETSAPSTAISYDTAYSVRKSIAEDGEAESAHENSENVPPDQQSVTAKPEAKPHMSKSSRTFHVLSSITQSFARSTLSLASFKSSRNISGASASTLSPVSSVATQWPAPKPASISSRTSRTPRRLSFSLHHPKLATATSTATSSPTTTALDTSPKEPSVTTEAEHDKEPTPSLEQDCRPAVEGGSRSVTPDPTLIYTAQPSAYWTGRFMALNDRYYSEVLDQDTLKDVLEELSSRSRPSKHLRGEGDTATTNNHHDHNVSKATSLYSGIAPVKTPRGILKPFPTGAGSAYTSASTTHKRPPISSGISRIPFSQTTSFVPRRQSYDTPRSTLGNPALAPATAPSLQSANPAAAMGPGISAAQRKRVILLTSDDHRGLRVLDSLDTLCATPAARQSLRAWQTAYARRTGKEMLLPAGETMQQGKSPPFSSSSPRDLRGRWAQVGRRSLSRGRRRDASVGSSNGTGAGLVSRLRLFSAGRRSQMVAGLERSEAGGGASEVGGAKAWTEGEGGEVWVERAGERRIRPKRIL